MKTEYHVRMTGERSNGAHAWMVMEHLYDSDPSGKPRATVISTHSWRSQAIEAARKLAGDSMYYVSDTPNSDTLTASDFFPDFQSLRYVRVFPQTEQASKQSGCKIGDFRLMEVPEWKNTEKHLKTCGFKIVRTL